MLTDRLVAAIRKVAPGIDSVSVGTPGDPSTVTVSPPELQATAQPTIDAFNWSDAAQSAWEAERAVSQAVTQTMAGMTPANISDRVTLRYVLTCINDVREHVGLPRILESDHLIGLMTAIGQGAGLPLVPP